MFKKEELPPVVDSADVARKLKLDYSRGVKDQNEKAAEGMCEICARLLRPEIEMAALAKEICDFICRRFGIESASIALRSSTDLKYRYQASAGLSESVFEGLKKLSYNKEDLLNPSIYKSYEVSNYSRIFLGEDHPYANGEEFSYTHPGLMGMKRRSLTDSLEADYIDTFMYDHTGDIVGYIEFSGTRLRKLPDPLVIKWIELLALMMSAGLRIRAGRSG